MCIGCIHFTVTLGTTAAAKSEEKISNGNGSFIDVRVHYTHCNVGTTDGEIPNKMQKIRCFSIFSQILFAADVGRRRLDVRH